MQIAADPRTIKNFVLELEGDTYEKHANNVNWTKTTNTVEWRGGTPDAIYTDSTVGSHVCNITLVHDYENPDSLFNWMIDHEGQQVEVQYKPDVAGTFTQTATITIVAPDAGGAAGAFGESTVACPSTKPVRTFESFAAPTISSIEPATGPAEGGTLVAITGSNFAGVEAVEFGDEPATQQYVLSSSLIHAIAPAGAAGAVDVVITTLGGASAGQEYTYTE